MVNKCYYKPIYFYDNPIFIERLLTVFVKGDRLVIYPFVLLILFISFFQTNIAILLLIIFVTLRFFFETIYWLLQQFAGGEYRPFDYGLKALSNNSVYIIYQLASTVFASIGIVCFILYLKYAY